MCARFVLFIGGKFKANNYLRFDERFATVPNRYKHALNAAKIILADVHELTDLKE